ncbi:MAG: methyltransferase [Bacteroidales bacterium]|jgi:tRNA1Val (adenine37-N6)-methyltransferase|nr:methyltransferase [Bacteroidales bacterium]
MESFSFKQFTVQQSRSAMKVNTDGVLLPAWVSLLGFSNQSKTCRVLDIGAGTGVISLIMAQRLSSNGPFYVTAIDIDTESAKEAALNFYNSPWRESLEAKEISLQEHALECLAHKYSMIISNPPFFTDSLKAPSHSRSGARHNDLLPFKDILDASQKMLDDEGLLAVVLPVEEGERFIREAAECRFIMVRRCRVKTLADKKEKRYLLEFRRDTGINYICKEELIVIQNHKGEYYTEQYCNLVGDFYLKDFKRELL